MMKIMTPAPTLNGYHFEKDEIYNARENGKLLSLRIETSRLCNLKCIYCYSDGGIPMKGEITYEEIVDIIYQACDLGVKSIVVIGGGEPTIYYKFREIIDLIDRLEVIPVVFTNCTTIDVELADYLVEKNASVIGKLDSLDEMMHDKLSGVPGSFKKIMNGIDILQESGFSSEGSVYRLGLSFVTTQWNINEMTDIWRFCRTRNIYPNQELFVPDGRSKGDFHLIPSERDYRQMKEDLLRIDRDEYGYDWLPYKPLTAVGCMQFMYSLYVNLKGFVTPCAGIQNSLINIRDFTLKEAIEHPFINLARNLENRLKGKCSRCEFLDECLGCRGNAYTLGKANGKNDYDSLLLEDPACWKVDGLKCKIT
jgi:radical SAM protein with 4Fe4S-binding SPASM domain